jgi:hypothetical protein
MYNTANNPTTTVSYYGPSTHYLLFSFDGDGAVISCFNKWDFENLADALLYASARADLIAAGNVVYQDPEYADDLGYDTKDYAMSNNFGRMVWAYGGSVYLSEPAGYEDLLADTGMKGETGPMTLREAFEREGFTPPPDDGVNLGMTDFVLAFFRDNERELTSARLYVFEGEAFALGREYIFYSDVSRAPAVSEGEDPGSERSRFYAYYPVQERASGNPVYVGIEKGA